MRVEKLVLTNFRGFDGKHAVTFHPRLTVLVGLNGAGKSAVLDAVAGSLSGAASLVGGDNHAWFGAGDRENVNAGRDWAVWDLDLERDGSRTGLRHSAGDRPARKTADLAQRPFGFLHTIADSIDDTSLVLPLLGYLHSGSTRPPISHAAPEGVLTGRLEAWTGAFDSEAIQFGALEDWFEQEENLENQRKIEKKQLKYQLPSLRTVRQAVRTFLETLHDATLGDLRVVRFHNNGQLSPAKGRLVVRKGDHELFLNQLSDGERRLVLLVADTARRMVILNPKLENALDTPGVLLIDEVELHLHPQWQRRVIPALQAAFPQVQLIVSTHAPAVLSTVPNECVVVLDAGRVLEGTPRVFGLDSNSILSGFMKTPLLPEPVQSKVDEIYTLIESAPKKAKLKIAELAAEVGDDHPELVRARGLLEFMAG